MNKNTPRDFFLYLFATGAIYFSAIEVIVLLWQYINYFFPDNVTYYDFASGAMRWAVATLIIVFPAYLWVMWFLGRDIDRYPEKKDFWVRRWLIYITLFLYAVTIIIDLVTLVYRLLGGGLPIQFTLKALAVLAVAAAIFAYYLFNLRRQPGTQKGKRKAIVWIASLFVAVLVIGAFFVIGSPATNRQRQNDQQRISDLQSIQWQVITYWQTREKLPESLTDLVDPLSGYPIPADPETGTPYTYKKTGTLSFQLCADFALAGGAGTDGAVRPVVPASAGAADTDFWQHDAGTSCFDRTIDPAAYPPYPKR